MTMRRAGEMDLDRMRDSPRGTGKGGRRDEFGEERGDSGCIALEEEGKGLECERARLGGG